MKRESKKKVLLGMSGGVDSSVAAYLLQKQGFDVIGVTLQMWDEKDLNTANEAKSVCKILNIEHHTFNVQKNFKKYVVNYFISEYESGKTPNPCVVCNRYVKFQGLIDMAKELNIEYIATGHYANIEQKNGKYFLKKAKDKSKDQTYFLYNLTQEQLSKTVFPLGNYTKTQIREIAKEIKLPIAEKPDSQEICFIKDNNYKGFIKNNNKKDSHHGPFVDLNGNIIGYHEGISKYTIGQRRGLGIVTGQPMFVIDIDKEKNRIVLGSNTDLFLKELTASNLNWIYINNLKEKMIVKAKIRYGAKESKAIVSPIGENTIKVRFNTPQRAITKGQSVVFYNNDYVLGGGIIS